MSLEKTKPREVSFFTQNFSRLHKKIAGDRSSGSQEQSVAFWGVVSNALSNDGQSNLPPQDDDQVVSLANVMYYFFIVCIVLLLVYLVCSVLLVYGAAKVSIF